MILTGNAITDAVRQGIIHIDPFTPDQINPNSYDVRLGDRLLVYASELLDTKRKNPYSEIVIPPDGIELNRNQFYVGHIAEIIGSDVYVPMLHGKLRVAKMGLFVHVTANLIDIGNHCTFSLHLAPKRNIRVFSAMRIAQVSFWKTQGSVRLYDGKYKGIVGPAVSQSYKHFPGMK